MPYHRGHYIKGRYTPYRRPYGTKGPRITKSLTGPKRWIGIHASNLNLQQEHKFFDTTLTDTVVASTGSITPSANLVPQGTTESTRIGRKIIIRSIAVRFELVLPSFADQSDIPNGDTCRIMLFVDKQANGANAAVLDILETAVFDSYRNLSNKDRFIILHDKFYTLNRLVAGTDGTNTVGGPIVRRQIRHYKKVNLPIEFNDTAGVITEVTSYNVALLYISSAGLCGIPKQETRIRYDG